MTEENYIRQNLTAWDRFKANAFFIPAAILFVGILLLLFEVVTPDSPAHRWIVILFIITFGITVILRVTFTRKVNRLKRVYRTTYDKNAFEYGTGK